MFQFGTVVVAPFSQMVEGLVFCKENMIMWKKRKWAFFLSLQSCAFFSEPECDVYLKITYSFCRAKQHYKRSCVWSKNSLKVQFFSYYSVKSSAIFGDKYYLPTIPSIQKHVNCQTMGEKVEAKVLDTDGNI